MASVAPPFLVEELQFVDLSVKPWDVYMSNLFVALMKILEARFKKDGCGFWGNRQIISKNPEEITIVLNEATKAQVGFCMTRVDPERKLVIGCMIESFEPNRKVATHLLAHIAQRHPDHLLLVEEPMEQSIPFWERYFLSNPRAGYTYQFVPLPHRDGGPGPHFKFAAPLSKGTFVQILDELTEAYRELDQRTFSVLKRSEGGIEATIPGARERAPLSLELRFSGYGFPYANQNWRLEWEDDPTPVLPRKAFQSRIGFSDDRIQWNAADFEILQNVFGAHGVLVTFLLH
jgi:hypothetical protein